MDVRDGDSIWIPNSITAPILPSIPSKLETEILVIGGGVSGALICHELMVQGIKPVLIDCAPIGAGSTAASTAILSFELDNHLADLSQMLGDKNAQLIYESCSAAIGRIKRRIDSLSKVKVSSQTLASLYVANSADEEGDLEVEVAARSAIGLDTTFVNSTELFNRYQIRATAALRTEGVCIVDPVAVTRALISDCIDHGMKAYTTSKVVELIHSTDGVSICLKDGKTVRAENVILATGYQTRQWLPYPEGNLITSYVGVTSQIDLTQFWGEPLVVWECSRPYTYIRPTFDGRLLVGGADRGVQSPLLRSILASLSLMQLSRRLQLYLPNIDPAFTQRWWGIFGESNDGLPVLGIDDKKPRIFYAYACGGNGMLFSEIASEMVTSWLKGIEHPLHRLLKPRAPRKR